MVLTQQMLRIAWRSTIMLRSRPNSHSSRNIMLNQNLFVPKCWIRFIFTFNSDEDFMISQCYHFWSVYVFAGVTWSMDKKLLDSMIHLYIQTDMLALLPSVKRQVFYIQLRIIVGYNTRYYWNSHVSSFCRLKLCCRLNHMIHSKRCHRFKSYSSYMWKEEVNQYIQNLLIILRDIVY